jgi:hypothetical protein
MHINIKILKGLSRYEKKGLIKSSEKFKGI